MYNLANWYNYTVYVSHTFGIHVAKRGNSCYMYVVCIYHIYLQLHVSRLSSNRLSINVEHARELARQRKGGNGREMETIGVEKQQGSEERSTIERDTNEKVYRQLPFNLNLAISARLQALHSYSCQHKYSCQHREAEHSSNLA